MNNKFNKEETGGMSQKRDREEGEDVVKDHKVPKLNMGVCDPRDLKDLEYWKYNIPPTWEELKESSRAFGTSKSVGNPNPLEVEGAAYKPSSWAKVSAL